MSETVPFSKTPCTAFHGTTCIASGALSEVALAAKALSDRGQDALILVFDDRTGTVIDLDLRGAPADVTRRIEERSNRAPATSRGPGRPKLGVVAREVTLLPRHWDWLAKQPGGASVALRKLVEQARRDPSGAERVRGSQAAAYKFMSAMAGDEPGFEEATRALFAGDMHRFDELVRDWPPDVRDHARRLATGAFRA
ncbi:MAG TPA: DUF2239 family protein [Vicinamibacterales bacterium]